MRLSGDRGAVTVEAAVALFALVAVLGLTLAGLMAVADQLRCTDAAREAARLAARGDTDLVDDAVARIAPSGASWQLRQDRAGITVTVHARPAGGLLPGLRIRAQAFAVPEPGVGVTGREPSLSSPR
ncbi:MAG: TadE family type IV pilus minor pilin [Haloechinothrix sp.]